MRPGCCACASTSLISASTLSFVTLARISEYEERVGFLEHLFSNWIRHKINWSSGGFHHRVGVNKDTRHISEVSHIAVGIRHLTTTPKSGHL